MYEIYADAPDGEIRIVGSETWKLVRTDAIKQEGGNDTSTGFRSHTVTRLPGGSEVAEIGLAVDSPRAIIAFPGHEHEDSSRITIEWSSVRRRYELSKGMFGASARFTFGLVEGTVVIIGSGIADTVPMSPRVCGEKHAMIVVGKGKRLTIYDLTGAGTIVSTDRNF